MHKTHWIYSIYYRFYKFLKGLNLFFEKKRLFIQTLYIMVSLFNLSKMWKKGGWIYIMISLLTLARCRRMGGGKIYIILSLFNPRCEDIEFVNLS